MKHIMLLIFINILPWSSLAQNFEANSIFPFEPTQERYLRQIAFVRRLTQQLQEQLRLRQGEQVVVTSATETAPVVVGPPRFRQPLLQQALSEDTQFQLDDSRAQVLQQQEAEQLRQLELQRQQEEQQRELQRQQLQRQQEEQQQRELQRQQLQRQLEEQRRQQEFQEQERQRALQEQQRQEAERQRQIEQLPLQQQRPQNFSRQLEGRDEAGNNIRTVRQQSPMTEVCLACICQASTNCNLATRCVSGGQYCGPFLISRPYWIDAGMPTLLDDNPNRPGAFEDCTADPVCSADAVRTYMTKFAKDCNNDGRIDCDDLGRIHLMGSNGCSNPGTVQTPFFQRFRQCVIKASNLN